MQRKYLYLIPVLALGFAIYWATRPEPVAVTLATVSQGRVESTVANTRAGTLNACQRARLSLAVGGQISTLPVKKGDQVARGQLLLELWNDDLKAQVALADQQLGAARARVEESCALANEAKRTAERLHALRKQQLVSEGQYDDARAQYQSRSASCSAARANVRVSQAQVTVARAALDRTRLYAPFDGIIAEINGELSEFVTPSPIGVATPPAVDLIDNRCVYVEAPIDEVDAPSVHRGQSARIALDAFSDRQFPGTVRRVAPYVLDREKQARTVSIEVDFKDPPADLGLKPGFSADVEVLLDSHDNVLRIPTEAVLEGPKVWRVDQDNRLSLQEITTGISNWRWTEVTGGLTSGERIVLSVDREGLKKGAMVAVEQDGGE